VLFFPAIALFHDLEKRLLVQHYHGIPVMQMKCAACTFLNLTMKMAPALPLSSRVHGFSFYLFRLFIINKTVTKKNGMLNKPFIVTRSRRLAYPPIH
jgi:hypothetical protein